MVVSCTIKVLAVCTAVWHLYRACLGDTWWVNSPCKAYTSQVAQEAGAIMTTATGPHLPTTPQDMPDWAAAGVKNCRGQMH